MHNKKCTDCKPCKENRVIPCIKSNTDCIYASSDLKCVDTKKGELLTRVLRKLDKSICKLREYVETRLQYLFINTGNGAEILKEAPVGTIKMKTLRSPEGSISISQEDDTIDFETVPPESISLALDITRVDGVDYLDFNGVGNIVSTDGTVGVEKDGDTFDLSAKTTEILNSTTIRAIKENNYYILQSREVESSDGTIEVNRTESSYDLSANIVTVDSSTCGMGEKLVDYNPDTRVLTPLCLVSDTISIEREGGSVRINAVQTEEGVVPAIVVNNKYTGQIEEGTLIRPFKNLSSAIQHYVGSGTRATPEREGAVIIVQSSDTQYNVSTDISYKDLTLFISTSTTVVYTGTGFFINTDLIVDSNGDSVPTTISIVMEADSSRMATTAGSLGMTNGNNMGSREYSQSIRITGGVLDMAGTYNESRVMFSLNEANLPIDSNNNHTNLTISNTMIQSPNNRIIVSGIGTSARIDDCQTSSGTISNTLTNLSLEPIKSIGGSISFTGGSLQPLGATAPTATRDYFITFSEDNRGKVRIDNCQILFPNRTKYLAYNKGTNENSIEIYGLTTTGPGIEYIASSDNDWTEVSIDFSKVHVKDLAIGPVDLVGYNERGSINKVGESLNAQLPKYSSREIAVGAGLEPGDLFINTKGENDDSKWILDIVL